MIKQEAGVGTTWSYTATADLVITSYAAESAPMFNGTWVSATSGVYGILHSSANAQQNVTGLNKVVLLSGQTLSMSNGNLNTYGMYIAGFEL